MTKGKSGINKDPERVKAGKKAWLTRLRRERDEQLGEAAASIIPGYGPVAHIRKAIKTQRRVDKAKRPRTRKRK